MESIGIIIVLAVLLAALVLFVTEWLRVDLVALLVLLALALTGVIGPEEAVAGFSSPAVMTVCAIFVISQGLYQAGVANMIGRQVLRFAGAGETRMIVVIMLSAGGMSFFMNTMGIVALMLPVVMDIARRTGRPPSRLLMPLAFGGLLGGLTSMFATLPNLLASNALQSAGYRPFGVLDFIPVGLCAAAAGVVFMALLGRHLMPVRDLEKETSLRAVDLSRHYDLHERMFVLQLPADCVLVGRRLAESRLGSALGLHVAAVMRQGQTQLAPHPDTVLRPRDELLVQGTPEQMDELDSWRSLQMDEGDEETNRWYPSDTTFAEVRVPDDSGFIGQTLTWIDFRQRFGVSVLAIRRGGVVRRSNLQSWRLSAGDHLLLHASAEKLEELHQASGFADYRLMQKNELMDRYQLQKRLFTLSVPAESHLVGKTLEESRLGDALGLTVMGVIRGGEKLSAAAAKSPIEAGDQLVAVGRTEDLVILRGLKELVIEREVTASLVDFESEQSGLIEAVLSPRTSLTGRTLRQLNFRDRYGLTVLGILREGKSYSTKLRDMPLKFGDALLLHGPREKLKLLAREPDFVVLTEALQERPQYEKSPMALLGLLCFLVPVLLGWVPIYIGALLGAAVMVLAGCLSIEKAYAAVNWRAVVLIAGMLPMGTAMLESGTAALLAQRFVGFIGPFGPHAIIAGIFVLTSLATCVIPSSALVVLLAPIALKTAADMGISPHAVMMTVAMAAAGSFNSPISHPANIMIMGPGGYRFVDYFRVGIPLTFVVMIVVLVTVPVFWPLDAVPK